MLATAWNNGAHHASGAGYGLKISKADRDRYFSSSWREVLVSLPGQKMPVVVELSPSFWKNCTELRHQEIGRWLRANGYAPWPKGRPPKFEVQFKGNGRFEVVSR